MATVEERTAEAAQPGDGARAGAQQTAREDGNGVRPSSEEGGGVDNDGVDSQGGRAGGSRRHGRRPQVLRCVGRFPWRSAIASVRHHEHADRKLEVRRDAICHA